MSNISYIWVPKYVSPFGDNEVYLTPGANEQKGSEYNYIVVCCSPSFNGVYKCKSENYKNYSTWINNKKKCYYVPINDCELFKKLDEIKNTDTLKTIKKVQSDYKKFKERKKLK